MAEKRDSSPKENGSVIPETRVTTRPIDCDHPFASVVAGWVHDEWGAKEGRTFEETSQRLFDHATAPQTHAATDSVEPLGVLSFVRFPRPDCAETGLWIDALFVAPGHRGSGIGSLLVSLACELARPFSDRLYVYTDQPDFYRRLGWSEIKPRDEAGCAVLERIL
ncbi:GNAT family N-acetyltransferase [Prosthecobacter sp.]|uniref:GNAT family N-acetyltransferase n=1 Tax=Prosthecobacter sp. TaxID=1965333 RepID=UPI001D77A573|nr:GNAT family N-acetyltransferase [Prosthecobacter sp.]MCB1278221.1 GNAT family N-acetyltransferase [Prosthecobacter sp.]